MALTATEWDRIEALATSRAGNGTTDLNQSELIEAIALLLEEAASRRPV